MKVKLNESIDESETKIQELLSQAEASEADAASAEAQAINYITEGIQATYVVQKKHESFKSKQ